MDTSPVFRSSLLVTQRPLVAALVSLVLVAGVVLLAAGARKRDGPVDRGHLPSAYRHRRDTSLINELATDLSAVEQDAELTATSAPVVHTSEPIPDKSDDYFPVYRHVGGSAVDWNSKQMSTDGFDVQSQMDFIDSVDYNEISPIQNYPGEDYDYTNDEADGDKSSKFTSAAVPMDIQDKMIADVPNSTSPDGKEFEADYSDFDDGQKFDEDEYETTFIQPGLHYGDNVEIVEQMMVRDDDDDAAVSARRGRVTPRRRRRRLSRPVRHRHIRLARARHHRRLPLRKNRLRRIQLSRNNIQLHPAVRRDRLTSNSAIISPAISYMRPAYFPSATGAVQYVSIPDYASYLDAESKPRSIVVKVQQSRSPASFSSSSLSRMNSRLGLVATSPEDFRVLELSSHKPTASVNYRHKADRGTSASHSINGNVVVPVSLRQTSEPVGDLPAEEVLVPLQLSTAGDRQRPAVQLVMPVKNTVNHRSRAVQLVANDPNDLSLLSIQAVHDPLPTDPRQLADAYETSRDKPPEDKSSNPTYIILKLSGNNEADSEEESERSRGSVRSEKNADLGENVKYVDLSELLSSGRLSLPLVTTTQAPAAPSQRAPRSQLKPRLTRPKPTTASRQRRPPRRTPPSQLRHRHRPPPPPSQQPSAPRQQLPRNDKEYRQDNQRPQFEQSAPDRRQYLPPRPPPPPPPRHQHRVYPQQQQQQQQNYQPYQPHSSPLNRHHYQSHQRPHDEDGSIRPGAILPLFRPTQV